MAKKIKLKAKSFADAVYAQAKSTSSPRADMAPYAVARLFDEERVKRDWDPRIRQGAKDRWTPAKVEALTTDAIVDKLHAMRVAVDESDFARRAVGQRSAWTMSDGFDVDLDGHDQDFFALACCVLWKRWIPERPSVEMIDDWIVEGYGCSERHEHDRGLAAWRQAWDALRIALGNSITTIEDAEEIVFEGFSSLHSWTQDYVEEHIHVSPAHADDGARLIDEILARFPDEDVLYRQDLMADKAVIFEVAGRYDDAARAARAVIDAWPRSSIGYATLADLAEKADRVADAIAAIELALAAPVEDADEFGLESRLEYLREEIDHSATPPR